MDESTKTDSIHVLMGRVLAELPAIGKNQKNVQQGFMYRGYDDVLNALNPLLGKHGVFVLPNVIERTEGERATARGGIMYVVNLHVKYRFYGPAGDYVEASAWGEGTDSGDKATNKAMTGALKYILFQAFAISTSENSDGDASTPEETVGTVQAYRPRGTVAPAQQQGGATDAQMRAIFAISKKKDLPAPNSHSLTVAEASAWIEANGDKRD